MALRVIPKKILRGAWGAPISRPLVFIYVTKEMFFKGGRSFRHPVDPDRFDSRSFGSDGLGLHRPAVGHPEGEDADVSSSLS